jgi:hemolysin III
MRDPIEEKWNSITHAVGIGIFLSTLFYGSIATKVLSFVLLSTYTLSVLYHASERDSVRGTMRMLDIASIQLSIYGSSLVYVTLLGGSLWACFGLLSLGVLSVRYVILKYNAWYFEKYLVHSCVFSGIVCLTSVLFLVDGGNCDKLSYFLAGCLVYLTGLFFYVQDEKRWYHTVWHIFVLLGSLIHLLGTI